jgi:hypothetical protein
VIEVRLRRSKCLISDDPVRPLPVCRASWFDTKTRPQILRESLCRMEPTKRKGCLHHNDVLGKCFDAVAAETPKKLREGIKLIEQRARSMGEGAWPHCLATLLGCLGCFGCRDAGMLGCREALDVAYFSCCTPTSSLWPLLR